MTSERALHALTGARADPAQPSTLMDDDAAVVDEWGASQLALKIGRALVHRRWQIEIGGLDHLPRRGGALLVTNQRSLALVAPMVALTLGERLGRTVRFAGVLDVAPVSTALRRVGGVLSLADEVLSALRGGDLVVVGATGTAHPLAGWLGAAIGLGRDAGSVPVAYVAAARQAGVPIHPTAVVSSPLGRAARVEVAAAVRPRLDRRGPLAVAELADRVRLRLQDGLDAIASGAA